MLFIPFGEKKREQELPDFLFCVLQMQPRTGLEKHQNLNLEWFNKSSHKAAHIKHIFFFTDHSNVLTQLLNLFIIPDCHIEEQK